ARDACQEAFLTAWRTLGALREPAAFGGWLKRLVRTQCARARRGVRQDGEAQGTSDAVDPLVLLSRCDAEQRIRRVVDGLVPAEREAIVLFYFLGEPIRTLARAMGVTAQRAGKTLY